MTDPILRTMMLTEAISSVALSHDPGCACRTCRAAGGDPAAMSAVLEAVAKREATTE